MFDCATERARIVPSAATMSPRGELVDAVVKRGLIGDALSADALKNWMLAACAATTASSSRITEARMLSRRDTSYPFLAVVVVARIVVVVVAHDLNPLSSIVDQVLWIARRQVRSGTVDQVVNDAVLSDLYGHPIEVIVTPRGRRVIVGLEEEFAHPHPHGHDHSHEDPHEHLAEVYEEETS